MGNIGDAVSSPTTRSNQPEILVDLREAVQQAVDCHVDQPEILVDLREVAIRIANIRCKALAVQLQCIC